MEQMWNAINGRNYCNGDDGELIGVHYVTETSIDMIAFQAPDSMVIAGLSKQVTPVKSSDFPEEINGAMCAIMIDVSGSNYYLVINEAFDVTVYDMDMKKVIGGFDIKADVSEMSFDDVANDEELSDLLEFIS